MMVLTTLTERVNAADALIVEIIEITDTPISLTKATGRLDAYYISPTSRSVGASTTRVRYANTRTKASDQLAWEGTATYRNTDTRPIEAVQIEWKFFGPFKNERVTIDVVDEERLLPGRSRTKSWKQTLDTDYVTRVVVSISAVRYSDGVVWIPPSPEDEEPDDNDEILKNERKRLFRLYEENGLESLFEALRQ